MIDLKKVQEAQKRVQKAIYRTPFTYAPLLSEMRGYEIYLKKENLQRTGAFKLRGAYNKIASLSDTQMRSGVVAASAGNHAQGVAFSAKEFGVDATIFVPTSTPLTKIRGIEELGASVILRGDNYDEAYSYAFEFAKQKQLAFVHPFADDEVMAGQGTVALEMLDEVEDLDVILVPVGGGGLISGVAVAAKSINPNIKIVAISAEGAPAMKLSYEAKRPIDTLSVRTIADGIAVRDTSMSTLSYILKFVDEFYSVSEDEIASAILYLLERQKVLVEGAGAVGVAALLHEKIEIQKGSRVGVILSGGNIDVTMLSLIIEKGLVKSRRKMKLRVLLVDRPGALQGFTQVLTKTGANIVQIDYDRTSTDLEFGDAHVSVALETKGKEHQELIKQSLDAAGFAYVQEA